MLAIGYPAAYLMDPLRDLVERDYRPMSLTRPMTAPAIAGLGILRRQAV